MPSLGWRVIVPLLSVALVLPAVPSVAVAEEPVFVDPVVRATLAAGSPQVVILVVAPQHFAAAQSALEAALIPFYTYPSLGMFAAYVTPHTFSTAERLPGLEIVYRNEHMRPYMDKAAPYVAATQVWKTYQVKGKGVGILIVDTGVDGTHADVKFGQNLVENIVSAKASMGLVPGGSGGLVPSAAGDGRSATATDSDGHGTHVASIAGGVGSRYTGIASEAKLVGFQAGVMDPRSGEVGFESTTVLDAFQFAIDNKAKFDIRVVSNSWGANGAFEPKSPINIVSRQMYYKGLVVTFAAGNEGSAEGTMNLYSVAPWVLAVAAGDYLNKLAPFSSRGTDGNKSGKPYDHPDVVAPGVGINAAKATTGNACLSCVDTTASGYVTKSGTSMATPIVSGIAALLISGNPKLSPDQVYDILTATTTPLPNYKVWEAGTGYVHALNAYRLAVKTNGTLDAFLKGTVKYAGDESGDPKFARDPVSVGYGAGGGERLKSGQQTLEQFTTDLVTTTQGFIFMGGAVVLGLAAFRIGGRRDG